MFWNEPQNHDVDCYFCNTTLIKGFNAKNKQQIVYTDVPSVAKSVFIHVPKAENSLGVIENTWLNSKGDEAELKRSKKNAILFDQAELNDLIRNLNLSKNKVELIESRLKENNLLNENMGISYRNREKDLAKFFVTNTALFIVTTYCFLCLADYCWSLIHDNSIKKHIRSSKRRIF